ncbi:hypothetical protein B0H14DRAFT_796164, partial [Mycena olivaceomarginata]
SSLCISRLFLRSFLSTCSHTSCCRIYKSVSLVHGAAVLASQFLGRRITIVTYTLLMAVFIPSWIAPSTFSGLAAGAFCMQFGVQGAWGIIHNHLAEMALPAFRATFPGVAYQLGNMVSSASAQIEATGGEHLKTTIKGVVVPDYAKVQGILISVVAAFAFVIFITVMGRSASFPLFPYSDATMLTDHVSNSSCESAWGGYKEDF